MDKTKFKNKKEWRKFAFGVGVILLIIGTVQILLGKTHYPYFYGLSVLVVLAGIVTPVLIRPIFIIFSYIGFGIGWFMTRLILSLLYYLVFTPIAIIRKLVGKSFLDLKFDKSLETYWIAKVPSKDKD